MWPITLLKTMLFTIGCSACSDASEPLPITLPSDPMDNLFGRLLDPQKVEIWHIASDPSLENQQEHRDMFDLPYEPRPWKSFVGPQRDNVMAIVKQADWEHSSIWKQKARNNYLICYHQQSTPDVIFWAIGIGKKLLWSAKMDKNTVQPPEPSDTFPKLTNTDPLWELHGKYKEMRNENEALIASNQNLKELVDQTGVVIQRFRGQLAARNQEVDEQKERITILEQQNQDLDERIKILHQRLDSLNRSNLFDQEEFIRNATNNEMELQWMVLIQNHSELLCDLERSQNTNQETISSENHEGMTIGIIGCAVGMVLVMMLIVLIGCRLKRNKKREHFLQMLKEYSAQNRVPGSVLVDFTEMDSRFRCSRDPQIAAQRHSILAEENAEFGMNHVDEVTEKEGIDVSDVTKESPVSDSEHTMVAIEEGIKEAIAREQKKQMFPEPLDKMLQNAVVVQEEVMEEIVDVMNTDKDTDPQQVVK